MLINEVYNKDELSRIVISELKSLGVKYRKEKKLKTVQNKCGRKQIFRTHLHLLELTDVILANGGIVQIPQFVSVCCQRILEQVETDGLFRKAGSSLRQKEIRSSLESGLPLGRNHHVIDVANVLKSFFRELPEPLLSSTLQEPLIRSLLIGQTEAILMTCLLLPPLTINTLAFFMQFLHTVSLSAHQNRMSIENLAIIFTPGLMPTPSSDIQSIRLNNHVKVIELLIEHSESIGVLPQKIASKLSVTITTPADLTIEKKKKKRRSGSLTRMFNGFKKIVGAIGSSENLENTPEIANVPTKPFITKSSKKRKIIETGGFSSKKKKELLDLLPNGGLLPNTPICTKEPKKCRLSLGGRRNLKYTSSQNTTNQTVERRWSIVGSGWSRKKLDKKQMLKPLSPVVSMPNLSPVVSITDLDLPKIEFTDFSIEQNQFTFSSSISSSIDDERCKTVENLGEFVRIPKSEYEAIKERVSSIEKRISQEFCNVCNSLELSTSMDIDLLTGPEKVINKFERTCEQTVNMTTSPTTDQLAKRLSRDLKIRQSTDNRIIRSPSARKIGSIRRRSREAVRLSRNATWHITATKNYSLNNETASNSSKEQTEKYLNGTIFYPKSNLKRGRPNTVQTGLQNRQPLSAEKIQLEEKIFIENLIDNVALQENWTSGDEFFKNSLYNNISTTSQGPDSLLFATPKSKSVRQNSKTPSLATTISINNEAKTPMLPPKSIPRRNNGQLKTPSTGINNKSANRQQFSGCNLGNRYLESPHDEVQNGRASIARLRAINAGMVMAKAKLFDGLGNECDNRKCHLSKVINSTDNLRRSNRIVINKLETNIINSPSSNKQRTPRRKSQHHKSPGFVQKRKKCSNTKYPDRNLFANIVQAEDILLQSNSFKNLNNLNRTILHSPRNETPKIKKSLKVNSPRRIMRTPRNEGQLHTSRTPLKPTPIAIRNSPSLTGKYFPV